MRLVSTFLEATTTHFERWITLSVLCLAAGLWASPRIKAQDQDVLSARGRIHQSEEWAEIQRHLPNPATAEPRTLEMQGDILRARRFPEDAMDYYKYALSRGGDAPSLMNKLGLAELEMKNTELARAYFKRAVKEDGKNAEAWNNLGAVEFVDGQAHNALSDYKRAIKLDKRKSVFHANLAGAYFQTKDYSHARREIAAALELDPQVFDRQGSGGVAAHVLSAQDRARFSFEMAKMYARSGMEEQMLHALATACEAGMDVQPEMRRDPVLAKYVVDPRVLVLIHNAEELRAGQPATVSASSFGRTGAPSAGTKPI